MLLAHPGELTRRYVDGQRTRYVSPLGSFLFMVFLMFFVASLTSRISPGDSADPRLWIEKQAVAATLKF